MVRPKGLLRDERGSMILVFMLVFTVLVVAAGFAIDMARLYLARSELSQAADLGSLGGVTAGKLKVKIRAKGEYFKEKLVARPDGSTERICVQGDTGTFTVEGYEKDLLPDGWRSAVQKQYNINVTPVRPTRRDLGYCNAWYLTFDRVTDRWVEYPEPGKARKNGEYYALANLQGSTLSKGDGHVSDPEVTLYGSKGSAYYPSMRVILGGGFKAPFLGAFSGSSYVTTEKCGQGARLYKNPSGGWVEKPADACKGAW